MTLLEAIKADNMSKVKELLAQDPVCIDDHDAEGCPMSFVAARTGNLEMVKYIVEYSRASMNTRDDMQRNILHYASESGNVALASYLVEKVGMSPVTGDGTLVTPYDIAHEQGHKDLEQYYEEVCGAALNEMYRNPIRRGMFADPSIVRVDEDYYMVNSSFIFFPCIPISHSKDLIHWKIIGYAITNPKWAKLDRLEGGRGYWAPDISYHDGKFTIAATYRMNDTGTVYRKQIVVSSDKAQGPYSEPAIIDEDGIDPSIFNDDDGKRYMLLNRGARLFELDKTGTKQMSEAKLLYYGDQKRAPEGPHIIKKNGYYYLFLAEGGTGLGHRITVARSKTLDGNYEACPYNPIMRQSDAEAAIQRCGHGKAVMTQKGEWFIVYLCGRMIGDGYSVLGRETAMDPITWTEDGWPIVNGLKGPSVLQKKPDLLEYQWEDRDEDDFGESELGLDWMFPRPPEIDGFRLWNNQLWLKGSQAPMSSIKARNILLRRQKDFVFSAQIQMGIVPMMPEQEAGMTCYYDENTWLKFALFADEKSSKRLRVIEHIGLEDKEVLSPLVIDRGADEIHFRLVTDHLVRTFYYSYDGIEFIEFGALNNVYYLCDEGIKIGKRFTGAMVGMYVYSGNHDLRIPFEHFKYTKEKL